MPSQPSNDALPLAGRKTEDLPGHWLLARLGKRVLRPGGRELTERLLDDADLAGADVLEIAPGLGKTAASIIERTPPELRRSRIRFGRSRSHRRCGG